MRGQHNRGKVLRKMCIRDRLYSSIRALLEGKLIEEVYRSEEAEDRQERRRYYKLTEKGKKALVREREEWRLFSGAISGLLREAP